MKFQTTNKYIRAIYGKIIRVYYCDLQDLLRYQNPFAYNCGVYGWNCDFYYINGVCISTGYRPIGEKVDSKIIRKYNDKARKIQDKYKFDYKKSSKYVNKLLYKFIDEITKEG